MLGIAGALAENSNSGDFCGVGGALIGITLGVVTAVAVDAAVFPYEDAPQTEESELAPPPFLARLPGMTRVAIWLWLVAGTSSCSGSTAGSPPSGNGGVAGTPVQVAGSSGSQGGSNAVAGAGGSLHSAGAGKGGAPAAGTGGGLAAGAGGADAPTGDVAGAPAPGAAWELPSGDPLNSTPPVLARLGDGVVLGGASTDPKLVGVAAFEQGIESEAFLAALSHAGESLWRRPLLDAGLPNAIAVSATQEIVVVAPYLPELVTVSPFFSSDAVYLGKFMANGTPVFEKELVFDTGTRLGALAVDATGAIWLAGAQTPLDSFPNESMVLAKYDAAGKQLFFQVFPHDGSTCYATALSITPEGDVVLTGTFNGSFSLGGDTLTTQATFETFLMPNGFAARFTGAGEHVWSKRFGGPIYDLGGTIAALPDGDIALSGHVSGAASVGGKSVAAEATVGEAFVARLDGAGNTRWLELATGAAHAFALEPETLHVAGNFGEHGYLQDRELSTGKLLRASQVATGAPFASAAALDGLGSLWLAGSYMGSIDFANQNQLNAASGVFLVRLDRAP